MSKMRSLLSILIIICTCASVSAVLPQEFYKPTATIILYGRYSADVVSEKAAGVKISGGVLIQSKNIEHFETTKLIPSRLGEIWGFTVVFKSLPRNRPFIYRSEVHHPPIKQPSGAVLTRSIVETTHAAGSNPSGHKIWHFLEGYEYELVPGKWTRKIFIDNVEVASMTFDMKEGR
ncbi:MAG: DUF3859 domain-containing protein [Methylococcales bacterium]